jgi:hypothetical protein
VDDVLATVLDTGDIGRPLVAVLMWES